MILPLLLAACGTTVSSCPPVPAYTDAEQDQAANELDAAVKAGDVMIPRMMGDYRIMRAQARRCTQ